MNNKPFSVLLIDDNKQNLKVLADVLDSCGYETGFGMNGHEALQYLQLEKPDLILLDVMMPDMDGYETCRTIKRDPDLADIPVIFLTAKTDPEDIERGFESGGIDYITKPFNSIELKSRVKTQLALKRANDELRASYNELREAKNLIELQNNKLNDMMHRFEVLSKTDPLTEISNRRCMIDLLKREEICGSTNKPYFSIAMGDIDFFKRVNDTYGHSFGDYVLKEVSEIMASNIRKADAISRWGGEEFLILFDNLCVCDAYAITDRIRDIISQHKFDNDVQITMTFGVSGYQMGDSHDDILKRVDKALYIGKSNGRNQVVIDN